MPAYAYPITRVMHKKEVRFTEEVKFDAEHMFSKEDFEVAGDDLFHIEYDETYGGQFPDRQLVMTIHRTRMETDDEFQNRFNREEEYMKEYYRRKEEREKKTK